MSDNDDVSSAPSVASAASAPSAADILSARRRLSPHLTPTPLRASEWLSGATGGDIRLKLETLQPSGSFKIRGALNALLAAASRGDSCARVVTASAGNHGRALAWAAKAVGVEAIVYTPSTAPDTKKAGIRALGATLHDEAADYDAAEREGRAAANRQGLPFVSPYNDPDVIAGAGTIGLELADTLPDADVIVVPLGGGGLASGVGLAARAAMPHARIIGVEVEASTAFTAARAFGRIVHIEPRETLADGLAGNLEDGSITFPLVQQVVDDIVVITEGELRDAMRRLLADEHLVVEGAGAAATAAVLSGRLPVRDRRVAVMLTGANVDAAVIRELL